MPSSHRLKHLVIGIIAVIIALAIFAAGEWLSYEREMMLARATLQSELSVLAGRARTEIEKSVELARGLAAVIAARQGISSAEFADSCRSLLADEPKIRNIALIVGSVIVENCPMPQNAKTIGVDLRGHPDQWQSFERMKKSGQPDIAGPANLLQGGWSIIVRIPIFMRQSEDVPTFWGAISMPLRMDGLLAQAGLTDAAQIINLAVRGSHSASLAPDILLGDPAVFTGNPVIVDIPFPDGAWQLAARVRPLAALSTDSPLHLATLVAAVMCGATFFIIAVYADRRRRLEAESNRNRDLLHAFMENAPVAMYVKDIDGHYIDLNAEARRAFGVGDRPYIGMTSQEFFVDPIAQELIAADVKVKRGEVVRTERNTGLQQAYPWEREIKFPVIDNQGKVVAIGGYVFDISATKEAEIRLMRALHAAEQANRAKSEFLATMSHELRTPLNAIIGFSDVIQREVFGPIGNATYRGYIDDIHASGQQLLDLLGGIIDLSAVESGRVEVKHEAVKPIDILQDCRAISEAMAAERQHQLRFVDRAAAACWSDRRLLRQVLLNLVSNAAKYTRKGGEIEIATEEVDGMVVFSVTDTGVGMSAEDIERAVEPFTRLGDTMRAEVGGSGIGLALVKRLVEVMRGRLHIESEPGKGTRVEVAMPLAE
ncbi:ATP-binding protein [Dongia rigui]|uniref:histidine kinase n=1 Tax=Dongia rigui TaxID=940149 RepID=A0ABU5DUL4_9PROT|nr:ATP-binding protein [Dongia rigui]MDY0870652.1 ATP-binding protein [Dongia rigui]